MPDNKSARICLDYSSKDLPDPAFFVTDLAWQLGGDKPERTLLPSFSSAVFAIGSVMGTMIGNVHKLNLLVLKDDLAEALRVIGEKGIPIIDITVPDEIDVPEKHWYSGLLSIFTGQGRN